MELAHFDFLSRRLWLTLVLAVVVVLGRLSWAQTASTGAVAGAVTDQSGAMVGGARVMLTNQGTGESRTAETGNTGAFLFPLLPPGSYRIEVTKSGFKNLTQAGIDVGVTNTARLNLQLAIGAQNESVEVTGAPAILQTDTAALGGLTDQRAVTGLPLVSRNYTQIISLYPGIATNVNNASALGHGGGQVQGMNDANVNGATASDNGFQMNGMATNDLQSSGYFSGGIPIPSPDAIQEFKVQTGLYDAAYGRNAGVNVDVVTKSGTNELHGTAFEFLRNDALNANDYFRNKNGQPRGVLRQNQFGGTMGGPIRKNKLFFFLSYQGTRQTNGITSGGASNFNSPPLTNDRSAATLGALFAGRCGTLDFLVVGACINPIAANGSNINPVAVKLLNLKLADGRYLFPTPQKIDPSHPFDTQGITTLSVPATYSENQGLADIDFLQSEKSSFRISFFTSRENTVKSLPDTNVGDPPLAGFPQLVPSTFYDATISHTYTFNPHLVNNAIIGFHRTDSGTVQGEQFTWADVGVTAPSSASLLPVVDINGTYSTGGNGQNVHLLGNTYSLRDSVFYTHGKHNLHFGGEISRVQNNMPSFNYLGAVIFLSFEDFLLGQNATQNRSAALLGPAGLPGYSNIYESLDIPSDFSRAWRTWDGALYAQDNWRITPRFTINLGLRYERIGAISDSLGKDTNFDPALANPNPPAAGTLAGFVVPDNYKGTVPAGVTKLGNNRGFRGDGQNTFGPRVGFAWALPGSDRFVLRGGYGIYYSQVTGQLFLQTILNPPFAIYRAPSLFQNAGASFANPFGPEVTLPDWSQGYYSPTTAITVQTVSQGFRPPITQQYTLGLQSKITDNLALDVAYIGSRSTKLTESLSVNQAALASPSNPIRGVTTNTRANIQMRVPYEGWSAKGLVLELSRGSAWFNSLQVGLRKRFSRGLQMQAAYTFSRDLATTAGNFNGSAAGGGSPGNPNDPRSRYGRSAFNREHRFVVSWVYQLPTPMPSNAFMKNVFGGWSFSGVGTIQSGNALTLTGTNSNNVYGITNDRAQLAPGCTAGQLATSGSVKSRLDNFFNTDCINRKNLTAPLSATNPATWTVIGNDGKATDFGNSGVGIVWGPGQHNWDVALAKDIPIKAVSENTNLQFRAEFFNAMNHPSFSNPTTSVSSPKFGEIVSTSVNPRIVQFALKFNF